VLRRKARKAGSRCAAVAKERPEGAPFAALRAHGIRLRTWSRAPAAKPTRPNNQYHLTELNDGGNNRKQAHSEEGTNGNS
jgi:hypothetical protein